MADSGRRQDEQTAAVPRPARSAPLGRRQGDADLEQFLREAPDEIRELVTVGVRNEQHLDRVVALCSDTMLRKLAHLVAPCACRWLLDEYLSRLLLLARRPDLEDRVPPDAFRPALWRNILRCLFSGRDTGRSGQAGLTLEIGLQAADCLGLSYAQFTQRLRQVQPGR